jgi:hypothetical protein
MKINKTIILKNGSSVTMHLSEEWDKISFSQNGGKLKGEFLFEDKNENQSSFLLKRFYSPKKFIRLGLGEAVLRFFKSQTEATIWARESDGVTRNDCSHLTGEAPAFVEKMQSLELIICTANN